MSITSNADIIVGFAPSSADDSEPVALRPFRADARVLRSELPGVADDAWTDFVFVMKTQGLGDTSASNGLGMFDLRFKRLADFNLVTHIRYRRDVITNRSVQVADWIPPLTQKAFLKSAEAQYRVFCQSMLDYFERMVRREIKQPEGVSVSGALAVLHKGGPGALAKWGDPEERFETTAALFAAANGVF